MLYQKQPDESYDDKKIDGDRLKKPLSYDPT